MAKVKHPFPNKSPHPNFDFELLNYEQEFLLSVAPAKSARGIDVINWVQENRSFINESLLKWGAILLRDFNLTRDDFKKISDKFFSGAFGDDYRGGLAPRERVDEGIYVSTILPKENTLLQHSELAYLPNAPRFICFFCETPATSGGETPICSNRQFMKRLSANIANKFKEKGVLYRRNFPKEYIPGYVIGWKLSYRTEDKKAVEDFCNKNSISWSWDEDDVLVTTNVCPEGVKAHPITGEPLWFNLAYTQNRSFGELGVLSPCFVRSAKSLTKELYDKMRWTPHDKLPVNTYYGDGKLIEASVLAEIDTIFMEEQTVFKWRKGDCLILDNMLVTHGRNPYEGEQRSILVSWT